MRPLALPAVKLNLNHVGKRYVIIISNLDYGDFHVFDFNLRHDIEFIHANNNTYGRPCILPSPRRAEFALPGAPYMPPCFPLPDSIPLPLDSRNGDLRWNIPHICKMLPSPWEALCGFASFKGLATKILAVVDEVPTVSCRPPGRRVQTDGILNPDPQSFEPDGINL